MDLISSFFGIDNISSLNLHQFCGHLLTALDGKYLNLGSELDSKKLDNGQIAVLKQLVSPRDRITIDPKNK